jgi:hypothetical protein
MDLLELVDVVGETEIAESIFLLLKRSRLATQEQSL